MNIKNTIEEFYKEWSKLGYRIYITIQNPIQHLSSPILGVGIKQCEYFYIEIDKVDGVECFYTKVSIKGKPLQISLPVYDIIDIFCREDINNQPGEELARFIFKPVLLTREGYFISHSLTNEEEITKDIKTKHNKLKLIVNNTLDDNKSDNVKIVRNFHLV